MKEQLIRQQMICLKKERTNLIKLHKREINSLNNLKNQYDLQNFLYVLLFIK